MVKSGGSVSTGAATRLVYTIGLIKWLVLALIAVGAVVGTGVGAFSDSAFVGGLLLVVWLYGAAAALSAYIFLGWLQQTLHMLVGIAKNTAKDGELDFLSRL